MIHVTGKDMKIISSDGLARKMVISQMIRNTQDPKSEVTEDVRAFPSPCMTAPPTSIKPSINCGINI